MRRAIALVSAVLALGAPARAQSLSPLVILDVSGIGSYGLTIGTSPVKVIDSFTVTPRQQLTIANAQPSNTVSCGPNSSLTAGGAGTIPIGPGKEAFWPRGTAPSNALYCVSTGTGTPLAIWPAN